ncbi:MAG: hypothetical protein K2O29_10985 [Ruminococcus sp.]|nr:hypothetical protein [Ruminococcus sp.]
MQKNDITVTSLLKTLNLSTSKGTAWKSGSIPKYGILKSIAEYFEVSVSYLFEEESEQNDFSNRQTNYGNIKGNYNATMNLGNNTTQYDETTNQVAQAFQGLSLKDKIKVMSLITELGEKNDN